MSGFTPEKQAQKAALGLTVAEKVRDFFKDARHRKKFEVWYEKRYGRPYQWEKVKI